MSTRLTVLLLASLPLMYAQTAKPPDAYSVTTTNALMGPTVAMQIAREGSMAVVEVEQDTTHVRTYYDLQKHQTFTLDLSQATTGCSTGKFSGDWGDPFEMAASFKKDLATQSPVALGAETVNGFATKVMEASAGGQKVKVWVDNTYGLIIKGQMGGRTVMEITKLSVAKPPASVMALPAACASAPPPPPTDAERFAAETGGAVGDFANAIMAPRAPDNGCTVLLRVVRAGSMQPVTGVQIALDTNVDMDHMANYETRQSASGQATFSGGALREVTGQMRNGVLRIDNAPKYFHVESWFGKAGEAGALIYRQCAGPQTVLLLVVKNPAKLSDGADWMWVKSGKFASAN